MSALLWPGDHRAGAALSDAALLAAMTAVESAWLRSLAEAGIAPADAVQDLAPLVGPDDLVVLAAEGERGGNPVIPLVGLLRERADPAAARWLHRGLTSQDVVDTALVLGARDAAATVEAELTAQLAALDELTVRHGDAPMLARTLTRPAVPMTFGDKLATWRQGVDDAATDLHGLTFPAQFGGAAGTQSGAMALAASAGLDDPSRAARDLAARAAVALGVEYRPPWHTARAPIVRIAGAFTACTAAWGRVANDVLTLNRPEIGELSEPAGGGRGASSTMPQKVNPVLSVLIRRAALSAPAHLSLLQLAAADTGDERPTGAWHVEWQPFALLVRHAVVAASQATELLAGLRVDEDRMRANLDAHRDEVGAEFETLTRLGGAGGSGRS